MTGLREVHRNSFFSFNFGFVVLHSPVMFQCIECRLAGMQEETRLENENFDQPNKKFSFDSLLSLQTQSDRG